MKMHMHAYIKKQRFHHCITLLKNIAYFALTKTTNTGFAAMRQLQTRSVQLYMSMYIHERECEHEPGQYEHEHDLFTRCLVPNLMFF
jgi:hypothetical protein